MYYVIVPGGKCLFSITTIAPITSIYIVHWWRPPHEILVMAPCFPPCKIATCVPLTNHMHTGCPPLLFVEIPKTHPISKSVPQETPEPNTVIGI